jgi:hypothetical protein
MKSLFAFAIIVFLLAGCEKHLISHRNKYWGDYEMTIEESGFDMLNGSHDTIYMYNGRVWYHKNEKDKDRMYMDYGIDTHFMFDVNKDGEMLTSDGKWKFGRFGRKSFVFSHTSGGLGGYFTRRVTGRKKH